MAVIGIRNYANGICFAILKKIGSNIAMLNRNIEHFVPFSKGIRMEIVKNRWVRKEFLRNFSDLVPFANLTKTQACRLVHNFINWVLANAK